MPGTLLLPALPATGLIEVMDQEMTQTMEYFDYVEVDVPADDETVDISDLLDS